MSNNRKGFSHDEMLSEEEAIQILHCVSEAPLNTEHKATRIVNVINSIMQRKIKINDQGGLIIQTTLFASSVICLITIVCNIPLNALVVILSIMTAQWGVYFICTQLDAYHDKQVKMVRVSDELSTILSTDIEVFVKFYEITLGHEEFERRDSYEWLRTMIIKTLEKMDTYALWLLRSKDYCRTVDNMINFMNLLRTRDIKNEKVRSALFKVISCHIYDYGPTTYRRTNGQRERRNSWPSM